MFKVWTRTLGFTFLQILTYIASMCTQITLIWFIYKTGSQMAQESFPYVYTIIEPGLIMIGLGAGIVLHRVIFTPILFLESLSHVIAITSVVTGLPQKLQSSRTSYAFGQVRKYFFGLSASTIVTKSTLKLFASFKDAVLNKDIIPHFQKFEHPIIKFIIKICINDIKSLLNLLDEILVSYIWLGTHMYVEYADKPKTESKEIIKQQARYMLEGFALFVKVFPSLLINNFAYDMLFYVITLALTTSLFFILYVVMGFSLWIYVIVFLFYRLAKDIIYNSVIYSLRCCSIIRSFYIAVDELHVDNNMPSAETLRDLVSKVPALIPLAKRTKDETFKDLVSANSDCEDGIVSEASSGLVDFNPIEEALRKYVNDTAKYFMVSEHDIIKTYKESSNSEREEEIQSVEQVIEKPIKEELESEPAIISFDSISPENEEPTTFADEFSEFFK